VQQPGVLLTAATAQTNDPDVRRPGLGGHGRKTLFIGVLAGGVRAGGGISLMEGQPLLRLFDAVVVEFVMDPAGVKRGQQIAPDLFRELAGVNRDMNNGRHARVVPDFPPQDKPEF
jgi:hypothetical protein